MLLCIDVGNTNITLGLYRGQELGPRWRLATDHERMPDEFILQLRGLLNYAGLSPDEIQGAAIASVVPPLTGRWIEVCQRGIDVEPLVIGAGIEIGVRVLYDDPGAVGADRLVDAVAAFRLYGGPACIVDFGTATTFDALSAGGDYLGAPSPPASASPLKPCSNARPSCPGSTLPAHRRPSAATRPTRCSRACSLATSAWWRAWWRASGRSWGRR